MDTHDKLHRVAVQSAGLRMNAWAASSREARALAEALYEARPTWQISIDGSCSQYSSRPTAFSVVGRLGQMVGSKEATIDDVLHKTGV
jgi:hypothetical protein